VEQANGTNTTNQIETFCQQLQLLATHTKLCAHFEEDNITLDIEAFEGKEPLEMTSEINGLLNVGPSNAVAGGVCCFSQ
jgi:hypothetical protein